MSLPYPRVGDLGLIGDRRTAAIVDRHASILWYSPYRFDGNSVFVGLLEPDRGAWTVRLPGATPARRRYVGAGAILETVFAAGGTEFTVTDWMTMGDAPSDLLCRAFSPPPADATIVLDLRSGYGQRRLAPRLVGSAAVFENGMHVFASEPLRLEPKGIAWTQPRGRAGWAVLASGARDPPRPDDIAAWRAATVRRWDELAATTTYHGPYEAEVRASLRALRLLVFEPTGAIVAAATLGLPEVIGGKRNYDYRYTWLRDTAMVVRALLRTAERSDEGARFLRLVAGSQLETERNPPDPVVTIYGRTVPPEFNPRLSGYKHSAPVRIGNRAREQLQIGALGNFLIAASAIFRHRRACQHWDVVETIANAVVRYWHEPDAGIWESPEPRHYTTSKVFAACGLEAIAPFAPPHERARYTAAAQAIREFVMTRCRTPDGAFAAFEGSEGVDVTSALFPMWSFCPADSDAMLASMHILQRDYERDGLFRREDETPESEYEGAFLPGSFWVAQHWAGRRDYDRARYYVEAGLAHANDLGLFAEEIDQSSGRALGNLPLGMSHASFLNAAADIAEGEAGGNRQAASERTGRPKGRPVRAASPR